MSEQEVWKAVPGEPGYEVSNHGRVRSPRKVLKPWPGTSGHLSFTANRGRRYRLHCVIAEVFVGPPPFPGALCRHRDDDPLNNRPENLVWGGKADNMADAFANGRIPLGEQRANAKLTPELVVEAARLRKRGESFPAIGAALGVGEACVRDALSGRRWSKRLAALGLSLDITADDLKPKMPRGERNVLAKLTEPVVRRIILRHRAGAKNKDQAAELKIHPDTVSLIVRRKTWVHVHEALDREGT